MVRYLIAGGTGALVHFAVLIGLVEYAGFYAVTASVCAFSVAFFVSFTLQKFWAFRNYKRSDSARQAGSYLLIGLMNLVINAVLMYLFVESLHLWYILAQVITTALIAVESYVLYTYIVFNQSDTAKPA